MQSISHLKIVLKIKINENKAQQNHPTFSSHTMTHILLLSSKNFTQQPGDEKRGPPPLKPLSKLLPILLDIYIAQKGTEQIAYASPTQGSSRHMNKGGDFSGKQ